MDVHLRSTTVCALDAETGEAVARRFRGNPWGEVAEWMSGFPGPSLAAYESGYLGFAPQRELSGLGVDCVVAAVSKVPRSAADLSSKNDRNDAARMAKAILSHDITPVWVPSPEIEGLRDLAGAHDAATARLAAAKQRLLAFLARRGYAYGGTTPAGNPRRYWTYDFLRWLDKVRPADDGGIRALAALRNEVEAAAETRDDCRDFLDVLARYRALSIELPLGEFLWHVVDDRAVMALTSAMPDGELRRRNVLLLLDLAQQFERTGARGLHRFLLWMQRQAAEGEEPTVPGSESRSVRILSIHKSKGLEFPFVFLCDTARLFNKSDTRASVLVHPALGLGPKCTDLEHGVEYPTIARQAIAAQLLTETLSEEMRLLYVAMTRAKERLIITGTTHSIAKTTGWLEATASAPLPPELLRGMASPLFWLLQSALLDRDERFLRRNYVYLKPDAAAERAETETGPALPEPDPALLAQLERALTFRYAHAQAVDLPSKVTATELKRLEAEDAPPEDAGAPLLAGAPRTQTFRRPDFSARARKLTAAERGTATHHILQYLHFADARTPEGIRAQVETLTARGELTGREAQAVDTASLLRLGRTELGAQLAAAEAAGTLRREFRFSLLCPAETFFPNAGDEQVLLQGVVDAWFETKDGLVIVDYKTDRIRPEGVPARTAYYTAQLRAYAGAMARITGQPVCRRVLYFLHCGQVSDVPGPDA